MRPRRKTDFTQYNCGAQKTTTPRQAVLKRKAAQRVTIPFFNRSEGQRTNPNRSGAGFFTQSMTQRPCAESRPATIPKKGPPPPRPRGSCKRLGAERLERECARGLLATDTAPPHMCYAHARQYFRQHRPRSIRFLVTVTSAPLQTKISFFAQKITIFDPTKYQPPHCV